LGAFSVLAIIYARFSLNLESLGNMASVWLVKETRFLKDDYQVAIVVYYKGTKSKCVLV